MKNFTKENIQDIKNKLKENASSDSRLRSIFRFGFRLKSLFPVRFIVCSFVLTIFVGTVLFLLPFSIRNSESATFFNAFYAAVSCTCVTGLDVHDTWNHFSFFGQCIMLLLIQVGGIGLVFFTTGFTFMVNRKLGLRDMKIMQEETQGKLADIPQIIKAVFAATFFCEVVGALLLGIRFFPKYGLKGIWLSIFLSVSSYCNAGFDVSGFICPNSSLIKFNEDPFVMLVVSILVITGGLGSLVLVDIYNFIKKNLILGETKYKFSLQTLVVLKSTCVLIFLGTILFFCFEYQNALKGLSIPNKFFVCFFHSVSSRTAGFFAFNLSEQYNVTKFITMIFMFIGASPASTGGGVKTVSFVVLASTMSSTLCGKEDTIISGRKISKTVVYRSFAIFAVFLMCIGLGTLMICMLEARNPISSVDILYEVVSAISTTGLSVGITRFLSKFSRVILMILMFIGRVGPISLILAVTMKKNSTSKYKTLPDGKLMIG